MCMLLQTSEPGRGTSCASSPPGGEQLRAFEIDPRPGGATLRPPPEDMRGRRFFAVDVHPGGARLRRLGVDEAAGRAVEAFTVTREQLGRLVDTLATEPETD